MKRMIKSLLVSASVLLLILSCDNGNADFEVFDSAPSITIAKPGDFVLEGDLDVDVTFTDGATEDLSLSPLESSSYQILEKLADDTVEVASGTFAVSGILTHVTETLDGLAPGKYILSVTSTDSKGNDALQKKDFQVIQAFETVGIIGSATPGGWGASTAMTQGVANPGLYTITVDLVDGEAKFRANNAWTINWGGAAFPNGTGTQDGPNIPVTEGNYKVTLDITTGAYKFEKQ